MARSLQFIGLTRSAEDFVKDFRRLVSIDKVDDPFGGSGMPLRRWSGEIKFFRSDEPYYEMVPVTLEEIVQISPWSSGPMIFTCLRVTYANGYDTEILQWTVDPRDYKCEFSKEKGTYWV